MEYPKKKFTDLTEAANFVNKCEDDFEARLQAAVDEVCSVENIRIVGLSGPTCSGKTTTAKKLVEGFSVLGRRVRILKTAKKKVVELAYSDDDDLEALLESICGGDFFANND